MSLGYRDLITNYKVAADKLTHKERAKRMAEIYDAAHREGAAKVGDEVAKHNRRGWLVKHLGLFNNTVEDSLYLLALGPVVDPLWQRVEADMPLHTAVTIARDARELVRAEGTEFAEAIQRALADYDARPNVQQLPDGKVVRKKAQQARVTKKKDKHWATSEAAKAGADGGRDFWPGIRSLVADYFRARSPNVDAMVVEEVVRGFEADLKTTVDLHMKKIDRIVQRRGAQAETVSRNRVREAFKALNLEPPKQGQKVDLRAVKRRYHKLAQAYHPDKTGTDATRPQYESAVEAWRIIEEVYAQ